MLHISVKPPHQKAQELIAEFLNSRPSQKLLITLSEAKQFAIIAAKCNICGPNDLNESHPDIETYNRYWESVIESINNYE